jgi:hypothetical protein
LTPSWSGDLEDEAANVEGTSSPGSKGEAGRQPEAAGWSGSQAVEVRTKPGRSAARTSAAAMSIWEGAGVTSACTWQEEGTALPHALGLPESGTGCDPGGLLRPVAPMARPKSPKKIPPVPSDPWEGTQGRAEKRRWARRPASGASDRGAEPGRQSAPPVDREAPRAGRAMAKACIRRGGAGFGLGGVLLGCSRLSGAREREAALAGKSHICGELERRGVGREQAAQRGGGAGTAPPTPGRWVVHWVVPGAQRRSGAVAGRRARAAV